MAPYRVIALGDSLTYGYPFGKPLSWVELASNELDLPILNQGLNGDTLGHMLRRLGIDVIDLRPEHCILLGGTNDVYQGIDLDQMKSNMEKILEKLLEENISPIIGLPPPVKDPLFEKPLAKFRNWLKRQAKASTLKTIDFFGPFFDKNKKIIPSILEDGVHPASKGYQAMAQSAIKVLKSIL